MSAETPREAPPVPTLRQVVEHLTLLTLLAAVSLYVVGRLVSLKYGQAFGIQALGAERSWESYVFQGGVGILESLFALNRQSLPWLLCLAGFLALTGLWRHLGRRPSGQGRGALRLSVGLFGAWMYVMFLLTLGASWGRASARLVKGEPQPPSHYLLTSDGQSLLPSAFHDANARGDLRLVTSSPDLFYLYDPATAKTYAVPARLVACRILDGEK